MIDFIALGYVEEFIIYEQPVWVKGETDDWGNRIGGWEWRYPEGHHYLIGEYDSNGEKTGLWKGYPKHDDRQPDYMCWFRNGEPIGYCMINTRACKSKTFYLILNE